MILGGDEIQTCILVVCSEPTTSRIWGLLLTDLRCRPIIAKTVNEALHHIAISAPNVIVVDVISREHSGPEICQQLREHVLAPIILLTPINNEGHTLEAYQAGCDECVIKPISPALFLAKVKVWLHRSWTTHTEITEQLKLGDLRLVPGKQQLEGRRGKPVRLSNLEFRVLHLLMNNPDQAFSNEEILDRVWGSYGAGNPVLVKNVIYRLRKKIETNSKSEHFIKTEADGGYSFKSKLTGGK